MATRGGGDVSSIMSDPERFALEEAKEGALKRPVMKFRARIGDDAFPAASGRYRLYLSYACPWAHRCAIVRSLKGLEACVSVTWTGYTLEKFHPPFTEYRGWNFNEDEPHGFKFLDELYELAAPGYRASFTERPSFTVPVLFDEQTQKIVSTESSEIIEMLNSDFNDFATRSVDLAPGELSEAMSEINAVVYPGINDGVYRCGFATSQEAYDEAYEKHWAAMDFVEAHLEKQRFLCGDTLTLADIRLFTTLVRYDVVYCSHFKTSRNLLREMPNLHRFARDIFRLPGVPETVNVDHIKKHYFGCQTMINPTGVVPIGPRFDLDDKTGLEDPVQLD